MSCFLRGSTYSHVDKLSICGGVRVKTPGTPPGHGTALSNITGIGTSEVGMIIFSRQGRPGDCDTTCECETVCLNV